MLRSQMQIKTGSSNTFQRRQNHSVHDVFTQFI